MLVYRIVHKKYASGLVASGNAGRWNKQGDKVIYTAESIPLAFLENMIRRQGVGFNRDFKIMFIDIPDQVNISEVNQDQLSDDWRYAPGYSNCQQLGHDWYLKGSSLLLKVPSAVLPEVYNYVMHSGHKDFSSVRLIDVTDLMPDKRIEAILKNYRR